jgi:hypothetical protein
MNLPIDEDELDEKIYEKIEKLINETTMFNTSNVEMVNIYFFYCINQSLEEYTKIVLPLKLGNLSKDDLLPQLLKYRMNGGRRFNVSNIYSYQFDSDIIEFLKEGECPVKEHKIEGIKFKPMVDVFQHYSSIFVIYTNEKTKHTKKMYEPKSKRKTIKSS